MKSVVRSLFATVILAVMAACAQRGGGCACLFPPPPLTVTPSSLALNSELAFLPTPVPVKLGPQSVLYSLIDVQSVHAELIDAYLDPSDSSNSTLLVAPVGGTATPLEVDLWVRGSTGRLTVTSAQCGRPDILEAAQLLYPPAGATNVPVTSTSVYVSGSTRATPGSTPGPNPPPGRLHFVMRSPAFGGDNVALHGTSLIFATPPPGSSTPAPVPNTNTYYGVSPMPTLYAGYTYDVYLYDDACEAPFLAGTFST